METLIYQVLHVWYIVIYTAIVHVQFYNIIPMYFQCCVDVYLSLEDFQTMEDIDKLRMILAKVTVAVIKMFLPR